MRTDPGAIRDAIRSSRSMKELDRAKRSLHQLPAAEVDGLVNDMIDARRRLATNATTRLTGTVVRERGEFHVAISSARSADIDKAGPFDEEIDATLAARRLVGDDGIVVPLARAAHPIHITGARYGHDSDAHALADS